MEVSWPRADPAGTGASRTGPAGAGPHPDTQALTAALRHEAEQLFLEGARRVQLCVDAADRSGRSAALRAGFRQEGLRRSAWARSDGTFGDALDFARLAHDDVAGPGSFSAVMNSALPRKRVIAHVLFRDDADRVLLCETTFKIDWELPGGIVEPLEPPRVGAEREIVEELGVPLPVGRLLVCDWMPPYLGWEDAVELIFDGGRLDEESLDTFELGSFEIVQTRFCTLEEAGALLTPLARRRLALACTVADGASPTYTEDGRTV
ncbi:MAG: NUDIX hydrolase [Propionibacteriaceae bacterium]